MRWKNGSGENMSRSGEREQCPYLHPLSNLIFIYNISFPHFPSTSVTLPQHSMIRWYSSIVVNIEVLTYNLFTFFSHNAYSTLRRVLQKFCLCHVDMCLKCDVNFDIFVFKILDNYNRRRKYTPT